MDHGLPDFGPEQRHERLNGRGPAPPSRLLSCVPPGLRRHRHSPSAPIFGTEAEFRKRIRTMAVQVADLIQVKRLGAVIAWLFRWRKD